MYFTGRVDSITWFTTKDLSCTLILHKHMSNKRGRGGGWYRTNYFECDCYGIAADMVSRIGVKVGDKIQVEASYFGSMKNSRVIPRFTMITMRMIERAKAKRDGQKTSEQG